MHMYVCVCMNIYVMYMPTLMTLKKVGQTHHVATDYCLRVEF